MGLDVDIGDAIGHIEIGSLREHTSTRTMNILRCTLSVSKIITAKFISSRISTSSTTIHPGNLPARYDLIIGIVACTYLVEIRQLNLVIVKVETIEVLIHAL